MRNSVVRIATVLAVAGASGGVAAASGSEIAMVGGQPRSECARQSGAILGTSNDDVLVGTRGDDVLCGFDGNDTLRGKGGNDVLNGHNGDDTLKGAGGRDTLRGGYGNDIMNGGDGRDQCVDRHGFNVRRNCDL